MTLAGRLSVLAFSVVLTTLGGSWARAATVTEGDVTFEVRLAEPDVPTAETPVALPAGLDRLVLEVRARRAGTSSRPVRAYLRVESTSAEGPVAILFGGALALPTGGGEEDRVAIEVPAGPSGIRGAISVRLRYRRLDETVLRLTAPAGPAEPAESVTSAEGPARLADLTSLPAGSQVARVEQWAVVAGAGSAGLLIERERNDRRFVSVANGRPLTLTLAKVYDLVGLSIHLWRGDGRGYRFRVETSVDGASWAPLADLTESDHHGVVHLAVDSVSARLIRIVGLSSSEGDELRLIGLSALSADPVPDLRWNLASDRLGGHVVSAPQAQDLIPSPDPARLVDGDLDAGAWSSPRVEESEAVEIELRLGTDGAAEIDAVALHPGLRSGEGMATDIEVLVASTEAGDDFVSVGHFDVDLPERPALLVFERRVAARVRIRLEGRSGERFSLSEIEVFEALGPGQRSVLADHYALPMQPGQADVELERDVAVAFKGGRLLNVPGAIDEAVIAPGHAARIELRELSVGFVLEFWDSEPARLDAVALRLAEVSGVVEASVSVADAPGGPFEPVGPPRRLPPSGRGSPAGWYQLDLEPLETRYLQVELTGEGRLVLDGVAALEAPSQGYVPLSNRGRVGNAALGPDLALEVLEARSFVTTTAEGDWSADALIDGTVADLHGTFPTVPGWQSAPLSGASEAVVIALPGNPAEPAPMIVAIGLDGTTATQLGERDDGFAAARSYLPRRVALAVTEGDPLAPEAVWHDVGRPRSLRAIFGEQRLLLPEPTSARAVRVTLLEGYGASAIRLGEVAVYETPESSPSVVEGLTLDLLAPALGGSLVLASSESRHYEAVSVLGGALPLFEETASPSDSVTFWRADRASLPQSLTFGFGDWRVVTTSRIVVAAPWGPTGEPGRPRRLAVETTLGDDPAGGFELLREIEWSAPVPLEIELDPPISLRFLRLRVLETEDPDQPAALGPVSVLADSPRTALRPLSTSTLVAAADSPRAAPAAPNSSEQTTDQLTIGGLVTAVLANPGDSHRYALEVPDGGAGPYRIDLDASPRPAFGVLLRDSAGTTLLDVEPGSAEGDLTVVLESGTYEVQLARPYPQVAIVVDDSGSMAGTTAAVERAVRTYLAAKPDGELVALIRFAATVSPLQSATNDAGVLLSALDRALLTDGATALYDGVVAGLDEIAWRAGDRALIVLSDGSDTASRRASLSDVWTYLVESGARLYGVGLGSDMAAYDPRLGMSPHRLLDGWARATGGLALFTTEAEALEGFYARIAADLRGPIEYRLGIDAVTGTGTLVVEATGEPLAGVTTPARVAFVLDCSGSMNERTDSRERRFQLARDALRTIIAELPDNVEVALITYGHRLPARPEEESCTDIELVVPFGPLDRDHLLETIGDLRARGETPIGRTLSILGDSLATGPEAEESRTQIVVITDGEESCSPHPEDPYFPLSVAEELRERGIDVTISVVGFQVDDATTEGLQQLASAGGGRFARATDESGLSAALAELVNVRFSVLDASNRLVAEGVVGGEAVALPAGRWRVRIEASPPALFDDVVVNESDSTRLVLERRGDRIEHRLEAAVDRE